MPLRRTIKKKRHNLRYRYMSQNLFEMRPDSSPAKVVVIGSGLSGLATALQLQLRGHKVTVLEAAAQIGGRAHTLREIFDNDLYADAGGFRYATDHYHIRQYIERLGLSTEPFYPSSGDMLLYIGGKLVRRKSGAVVDPSTLPRPLNDEESWMLSQETEESMHRICGGVDRLVYALEKRLNDKVHLHSEVKRIEHSSNGVRVEYNSDGNTQVEHADFAVCAIPFCSLRNITFMPILSTRKQTAIDSLEYRAGMLVYFQMPSEYWLEQNLSGFALTDTVGELWTYGLKNSAGKCATISYTKDEVAKDLLARGNEQRIALTRMRCEEFLPWFKDFARDGAALSWDEDPYIGGTRSIAMFLNSEQMATIREPEKRIHFAGEHAATSHFGWMEGALESAHRVAEEISKALL